MLQKIDKIRYVLEKYNGYYKETPEDLLTIFESVLKKKRNDQRETWLDYLIFPDSPVISSVHPLNGTTALHLASQCEDDSVDLIQTLIDLGANINAQDSLGNTPLHNSLKQQITHLTSSSTNLRAGAIGFLHAEVLIINGADLNICNKNGETPIQTALYSGHYKAVEIFLKEEDLLPYSDEVLDSKKALQHLVKCLLKEKKNYNNSANYPYLLHFSIHQRDDEVFQYVLKNTDLDISARHNTSTLLHIAAAKGTPFMIKTLIDKGADPNNLDGFNKTPLLLAILHDNSENAECLLECGASANCMGKESLIRQSHLISAAYKQNFKVVKMLVEKGANVNELLYQVTPLLMACGDGLDNNSSSRRNQCNPEIVQFLLEHGAHVEVENRSFMTPLEISCALGNLEVVNVLLRRGAKIRHLRTLHSAVCGKNADIVKLIVKMIPEKYKSENINSSCPCHGTVMQIAFAQNDPNDDILTIFVAICAELIASNKVVSEENRKILENETVQQIYMECEEEIARMKVNIYEPIAFTYFDILTKNIDYLGGVLNNPSIANILQELHYKYEFEIYAETLEARIREANYSRFLTEWALFLFSKYLKMKLPLEIQLIILKRLNITDLNCLAKACFGNVPSI